MTTLDLQVGAGEDDVRHTDAPAFSSTLAFEFGGGGVGAEIDCAARFIGVTIPKGAIIDVAFLTITARTNQSGTVVRTNIQAHDDDNSARITSLAEWDAIDPSGLTTAADPWDSVPAFVTDAEENSASIVNVIQEIVDRDGWVSGNAINLFLLDDGSDTSAFRSGKSYDNSVSDAPKLHIEYTEAAVAARGHAGGNSHLIYR